MGALSERDRALVAAVLRKAASRIDAIARRPKWSRAKGSEARGLERFEIQLYESVAALLRQWADQARR